MLNRALRTTEVDFIVKMGFFIRDLHNHIFTLQSEQYDRHHHSDSFTMYRGQDLYQTDLDQFKKIHLVDYYRFIISHSPATIATSLYAMFHEL
jgi:hypothetical protein